MQKSDFLVEESLIGEAWFSPCRRYRYLLSRTLGGGLGVVTFIMVNPSTADSVTDDPTLRRVIGFAKRCNASSVFVVNNFSAITSDVEKLGKFADPYGPLNSVALEFAVTRSKLIVAAWGPLAKLPKNLRDGWVSSFDTCVRRGVEVWCFGKAKDGHPRHPLMLPADAPLVKWNAPSVPAEKVLFAQQASTST